MTESLDFDNTYKIYISIDVHFISDCTVDHEFTDSNYKPSPDGIFAFALQSTHNIAMEDVAKLKIEFSGSWIPHFKEDRSLEMPKDMSRIR